MEYTVYCDGQEYRFQFNYIETVGDLQTVIIQSFDLDLDKILHINTGDSKVLGVDYTFDKNLVEQNLYNTTLFVVSDYHENGTGTKQLYKVWLRSRIENTDLMEMNRQLLNYYTLNNQTAPNASFFQSQPTVQQRSRPRRPQRQQQQQQPHTFGGLANLFAPSSGTEINSGNNWFGLQTNNQNGSFGFGMAAIPQPGAGGSTAASSNRRRRRPVVPTTTGPTASAPASASATPLAPTSLATTSLASATVPTSSAEGDLPGQLSFNMSGDGNPPSGQMLQSLFTGLLNTNGDNVHNVIQDFMNQNNISDFDITFSSTPLAGLSIPSGGPDFFNFLMNNNFFDSVPITLNRESLNRLPVFKYRELPSEINQSNNCAICQEDYSEEDDVRVLLCRHYFHKSCIDRWLSEENVRCPVCRHDNRPSQTTNESDDQSIESNEQTENSDLVTEDDQTENDQADDQTTENDQADDKVDDETTENDQVDDENIV
jgi:hypothetical protein